MVGVPTNFQAISNVLANYNFVDIASGTGYINFYVGNTVDLKLLSNFTYYSDSLYDEGNTTNSNYELLLDHDFDVLLNRPLDIKGLAIVNIPIYIYSSGSAHDGYAYAVIYLRKWDGATETDIATNTSTVHTTPSLTDNKYWMTATDLDCPLTHLKKGEYLRLTIMIYGKQTGGAGTATIRYGHDPKNRTTEGVLSWDSTGAVPSQLVLECPVRLNL